MSNKTDTAPGTTGGTTDQNEIPSLNETSTTANTHIQNSRPNDTLGTVVRTPGLQRVATVATRLVTNGEAFELSNNTQTRLRTVRLIPERLLHTFEDILHPLIFGNYRSLGVKSSTDVVDVLALTQVRYTAAVNAVHAAYAVAYTKATRGNYGVTNSFGGLPEADHFRFPSLLTALINSLGPVTRDTEPYQANFVPVLSHTETAALDTDANYQPSRYEQFLTGLQRARNINFTDVDVNSQESSPWWMLHIKKTDEEAFKGNVTVFNPIPFEERDPCTVLAGLVIRKTLYNLPGPLRTQTIGPFLANQNPDFSDVPEAILNGTAFNRSPYAFDHQFTQCAHPATNAEAYVLYTLQADSVSAKSVDPFMTAEAKVNIETEFTKYNSQHSTAVTPKLNVNPDEEAQPPKRARTDVHITANIANADDESTRFSRVHVTYCTIMWFNHILYSNFNCHRCPGNIIEACRTDNTQN